MRCDIFVLTTKAGIDPSAMATERVCGSRQSVWKLLSFERRQRGGERCSRASAAGLLMSTEGRQMRLLFAGCLTSQHHASASQGRICSDNRTC